MMTSNMTIENEYYKIKDFPNDVYCAVGKIIQSAQAWEFDFKTLAKLLGIEVKNVNKSSLNKLNDALKKENHINKKEFDLLKEIIQIRNDINHDFFLSYFNKLTYSHDQQIEIIEKVLNSAQFLIYEAIDFVDNKIDKLNGGTILRRTVFDNN